MKKYFKKIIYCIDYILLKYFFGIFCNVKKIKKVHISFDDVFDSIQYQYREDGMIPQLDKWHAKYGGIFHLFVFWKQDNYCLDNFSISQQLNKKWLYYAPHNAEYINETMKVIKTLQISNSVRFHEYKATNEQLQCALSWNEYVFLCDDKKRCSYDLSENEKNQINSNNILKKCNKVYFKTHIRLEEPVFIQLLKIRPNERLVIFSHEWAFKWNKARLEVMLKVFNHYNVEFI